MFARKDARVV